MPIGPNAKLRKLTKFINSIGNPKRILIAGLPEKYGFSMDFFWLGGMLNAETIVIDDRSEALERAGRILSKLKSEQLINETKISFIKTETISEFNNQSVIKNGFDLVGFNLKAYAGELMDPREKQLEMALFF